MSMVGMKVSSSFALPLYIDVLLASVDKFQRKFDCNWNQLTFQDFRKLAVQRNQEDTCCTVC